MHQSHMNFLHNFLCKQLHIEKSVVTVPVYMPNVKKLKVATVAWAASHKLKAEHVHMKTCHTTADTS